MNVITEDHHSLNFTSQYKMKADGPILIVKSAAIPTTYLEVGVEAAPPNSAVSHITQFTEELCCSYEKPTVLCESHKTQSIQKLCYMRNTAQFVPLIHPHKIQ